MGELGSDYIRLTYLYSNTQKDHIINKINEICPKIENQLSLSYRNKFIADSLKVQERLVDVWMNPRRDGKMPLIKLCELAKCLNVEVMYFLNDESCQSDS